MITTFSLTQHRIRCSLEVIKHACYIVSTFYRGLNVEYFRIWIKRTYPHPVTVRHGYRIASWDIDNVDKLNSVVIIRILDL